MTDMLSGTALVETLSASCRGRLLGPDDVDYETARQLYNAMIDKRPGLIARCLDVADVIAAVNAGREAGLDIAIRGGGHNGPGLGSVDDGLVIDLAELRGVIVDPELRVAHVLGGTLLGEVDHATQAFGLAAPFGIISTTGAGGLTLGGGVGNLTRTLGLTIDNLLEALGPARGLEPALDGIQPMPPAALNSAFDPIYPPGDQWYWRSHVITDITDEAVAANMEFARTLPTWKCTSHFYPISGAAARV